MTSPTFNALARIPCNTLRAPALSDGKRGSAVAFLTGLRCTPLDPINSELTPRSLLNTPGELIQTFIGGEALNIREGDLLVVDGRSYPIRAVEDWEWDRGTQTKRLVLEQLKR